MISHDEIKKHLENAPVQLCALVNEPEVKGFIRAMTLTLMGKMEGQRSITFNFQGLKSTLTLTPDTDAIATEITRILEKNNTP